MEREPRPGAPRMRSPRLRHPLMPVGVLVLIGACMTPADQTKWIQVGTTTKEEVVRRYGEPDLVIVSPEGETATYRPTAVGRPAPFPEIPTAQMGPLGPVTTTTQQINLGLGVKSTNAGTQERPAEKIQIRYDVRGIVQELLQ